MTAIKKEYPFRNEILLNSKQGGTVTIDGQKAIMLASNNYLGLSTHPRIIAAAIKGLNDYGYGLASVPVISGFHTVHKELEKRIATFIGCKDALLFASCFMANAGFFDSFLAQSSQDGNKNIYNDASNHPSIFYGIKIATANSNKVKAYTHHNNDLSQLSNLLQSHSSEQQDINLIVTSGVFYTSGEQSRLQELIQLKDKHKALLYMDDSHGTGVLGTNARGAAEEQNVLGKPDFIVSTFSKALGGACGGFIAGNSDYIDYLRQKTVTYTNSSSIPPSVAYASIEALNILEEDNSLVTRLRENAHYFRSELKNLGFDISEGNEPIILIMIGEDQKAKQASEELLKLGVYCREIGQPMVPEGKARLRVQISATHGREELDQALDAFSKVNKKMNLARSIRGG